MTLIKKDRYLKSTKVSERNNHKSTEAEIIKAISKQKRENCEPGCVSNLTHSLLCEHKFLDYVGNDSIVNKKLLGCACEPELRGRYNSAINNQKFFRSYELYEDIHLQMQTNKITKYNQYCDCNIQPNINDKKLNQIQADFEIFLGEKTYTPNLKNTVQCYEFFEKQGCRVEETKHGITIHFPHDRDFTLPDELDAIKVIAKEKSLADAIEKINFNEHTVTVVKEADRN